MENTNAHDQNRPGAASGSQHRLVRRDVFGWFDSAEQTTPAHDPGVESGICPLCAKGLERPVVTVSLMPVGDKRSYFYRVHKSCHVNTPESDQASVEGALIDLLCGKAPNGEIRHR